MQLTTSVYVLAVLYGLIHALVDFSSAVTVYRSTLIHTSSASMSTFGLIILYNSIAFGIQWLIGLLGDTVVRFRRDTNVYRFLAGMGVSALAAGLFLCSVSPQMAVCLAGLGNACFHVGCGAIILHYGGARGTYAGIFVGPGAAGLSLGMVMGVSPALPIPVLLGLMAMAVVGIGIFKAAETTSPVDKPVAVPNRRIAVIALVLILFAVSVRAITGRTGFFTGMQGYSGIMAIGIAACLGKIAGGVIADRIGWIPSLLISSIIAASIVIAGNGMVVPALVGMCCLQIVMPVTLIACARYLPGRPGFAFGLASGALITGSLATFFPHTVTFFSRWMVALLVILSSVAIIVSLRLLNGLRQPSTG